MPAKKFRQSHGKRRRRKKRAAHAYQARGYKPGAQNRSSWQRQIRVEAPSNTYKAAHVPRVPPVIEAEWVTRLDPKCPHTFYTFEPRKNYDIIPHESFTRYFKPDLLQEYNETPQYKARVVQHTREKNRGPRKLRKWKRKRKRKKKPVESNVGSKLEPDTKIHSTAHIKLRSCLRIPWLKGAHYKSRAFYAHDRRIAFEKTTRAKLTYGRMNLPYNGPVFSFCSPKDILVPPHMKLVKYKNWNAKPQRYRVLNCSIL